MSELLERCPTLRKMIESQVTHTVSGESIPLHSNIRLEYAEALYQTVRRLRPRVAVEVGMAFGVASLAILSALRENGGDGTLISIDPMQSSEWKGGGIAAVSSAGLSGRHQVLEEPDYAALPRLLGSGLRIDFAYIDGWHTFDYTLLGWWYIDRMLPVGGVVGFNDCDWPAVDKVIRFVLSHRKYTEIDVGLPAEFSGYTRATELARRLMRRERADWYLRAEDRYVRKDEVWEPRWDFYAPF